MIQEKSLDALRDLRAFMRDNDLNALYLSGNDPHLSETSAACFNLRPFLSGFTGSTAEILITHEQAYLWCDGRYFLQAKKELYPWFIMIGDDPRYSSFVNWLVDNLEGEILGLEPSSVSIEFVDKLKQVFQSVKTFKDLKFVDIPWHKIWKNRPQQTFNALRPFHFSQEKVLLKISKMRQYMKDYKADFLIISSLEDIAWLLNLRGEDIRTSLVFYAYLIIGEKDCQLFIGQTKLIEQLGLKLQRISLVCRDYSEFFPYLVRLSGRVWLDAHRTCYKVFLSLGEKVSVFFQTNPSTLMKMIKTANEIQGFQEAHEKEGIVWLKLWLWLKEKCREGAKIKESNIEKKLAYFRGQQEGFIGESFPTICAWSANGAVVHYKVNEESDRIIEGNSLLLLDAGAHYQTGTTDMTRTFALFEATQPMRQDYTRVLKGLIRLISLIFPSQTLGEQIDALARLDLWKEGLDYAHSTGHGVGYCLNVHEGPCRIGRCSTGTPLKEGMIFSQEPGVYKEGSYGIRLENLVWVKAIEKTGKWQDFYCFETLSLCPFDSQLIEETLLNQEEAQWLSDYHVFVYDKLGGLVEGEVKEFLLEVKHYFLDLAQRKASPSAVQKVIS